MGVTTMTDYWFSLLFMWLLIFKGCIAPVSIHQLAQRPITTSKGKIRGVLVEFPRESQLRTVEGYFGIPFASGSLRFMPPSEVIMHSKFVKEANDSLACPQIKWRDRLFAGSEKPKGSQIHFYRIMQSTNRQHESCLFLNIFVPPRGKSPIDPISKLNAMKDDNEFVDWLIDKVSYCV
ncbi:NLGN [Mytilus coruscus]|uniref:NLGN n=1 Tax=Mytilus coruscus TaxID=42192 RepID=A0A6J8DBN1_MYTCO|nr:NLGN [Mytilus coruscus]